MKIITNVADLNIDDKCAVAIGKFDGVHIGHRRLLEEILRTKKTGLKACVFTFDPSPAVFFGLGDGKELTTKAEKRILLEKIGVDILVEFPLDKITASMPPEKFVENILVCGLNAKYVAAGIDLSFGAGGKGNADLLIKKGNECDFEVKIIEKVCMDGKEVSSSLIRKYVEAGDMPMAGKMLGGGYPIIGSVKHGNRIGRTLGFPTVNLIPEKNKLLPPDGVYTSDIVVRGKRYNAISNVGCKPTVTDEKIMGVETYIYDFSEDLYGEDIEVYLKEFERPEKKFKDIKALKEQLDFDIESMRPM